VQTASANILISTSKEVRKLGVAASAQMKLQARVGSGGGTLTITRRFLAARPIRVG
jgi:hypothetical protein